MHSRIHAALDDELSPAQLNQQERAEFDEAEAFFDGVIRAIPDPHLPPLAAAVLGKIRSSTPRSEASGARHSGRLRRLFGWFVTPRPIVIDWRPAYGFGIAVAVLFLLIPARDEPTAPRVPAAGSVVLVQFRLDEPSASHVALAGDFTAWKPAYTLRRSQAGVWTVVVPLRPGVHDYAFVVDGDRWLADPMAPAIADGFGGLNSRLAVLPSDQETGT